MRCGMMWQQPGDPWSVQHHMSALFDLAWLWNLAAGVLAIGGAALIVRVLIGDQARGRRRCQRCWYELGAISPERCPECGERLAHESKLTRTRRSWRWAGVGVLAVLIAYPILVTPTLVRRGVWYAMPGWMLVRLVSIDERAWISSPINGTDSPQVERALRDRLNDAEVGDALATAWKNRVLRAVGDQPRIIKPEGSSPPVVVRAYDLGPLVAIHMASLRANQSDRVGPDRRQTAALEDTPERERQDVRQGLGYLVLRMIAPEHWRDSGGLWPTAHAGDWFVAEAPANVHDQIAELLKALGPALQLWVDAGFDSRATLPEPIEVRGLVSPEGTSGTDQPAPAASVTKVYPVWVQLRAIAERAEPHERPMDEVSALDRLLERLADAVEPESWIMNGGELGYGIHGGLPLVIIRHTPHAHEQIRAWLDRASQDPKMLEIPTHAPSPDGQ